MKAQSVPMKKRVNYGIVSADDPNFHETLQQMEIEHQYVKKQVVNTPYSVTKTQGMAMTMQSPSTSGRTYSMQGSPPRALKFNNTQSFQKGTDLLSDSDDKSFFSSEYGQQTQDHFNGYFVEVDHRDKKGKHVEGTPVYECTVENEHYYQRTVIFEESRQQRENKNSMMQSIQKKSVKKGQMAGFMEHKQQIPVIEDTIKPMKDELLECVGDLIESLNLKNDDVIDDNNHMNKQLQSIIDLDVKPLASSAKKSQNKIRGLVSHDSEISNHLSQISQTKEQIQQQEQQYNLKSKENDQTQRSLVKLLQNSDNQEVIVSNETAQLENQLEQLIEQTGQKQVWLDRTLYQEDPYIQFREQQYQYVNEENNMIHQCNDLDKDIAELKAQLVAEMNHQTELEASKLRKDNIALELTSQIKCVQEDMQLHQQLFEKYIKCQKERQQDINEQAKLLISKTENYNKEMATYEETLQDKLKENEEYALTRNQLRYEDPCVNFIDEIIQLQNVKADQIYSQLEGQLLEGDDLDHIDALQSIERSEKDILQKMDKIDELDKENDYLCRRTEQDDIDLQISAVLLDVQSIINRENVMYDSKSKKIVVDNENLSQIINQVQEHNNIFKTYINQRTYDIKQTITEINQCNSMTENQQEGLKRDVNLYTLQRNLQGELTEKDLKVKDLDKRLIDRKQELKELEWYQRKKDDLIEELEVQAGRDKRVIKEVLVDKVRESKVDEIMEEVIQENKVPITKINDNYYEFGTRKIYVKLDPETEIVTVRDRGGKHVEVRTYVKQNQESELERIAKGDNRYTVNEDAIGATKHTNLQF